MSEPLAPAVRWFLDIGAAVLLCLALILPQKPMNTPRKPRRRRLR